MDKHWLLLVWLDGYAFEPIRLFDYDQAVRMFHDLCMNYDAVYVYATDESGSMQRVDIGL